uniref:Olfactory receptor family 4 subfamily K member 2 n=1 Tax=Cavia porcellus TaxID=10141 RepID=A0A286Y3V7_CAVPO
IDMGSKSIVSEFVFLGLCKSWELQMFYFMVFSLFYVAIVVGNTDSHLYPPMYFLLSNLSIIDMSLASFATPKMVTDYLTGHKTISFNGCITQTFLLHLFTGTEIILLMVMSLDRYIAICKPLRYTSVISAQVCVVHVVASWVVGIMHSMNQVILALTLPFCGPNKIVFFFFFFFLRPSCGVPAGLCGYLHSGWYNSHFIVVFMLFGPCIFIYMLPQNSFLIEKILCFIPSLLLF